MVAERDLPRVSASRVSVFRLRRHHLASRSPRARLAAVASGAGGIQAQVPAAARLALWCRVGGLQLADVERALWRDKTLVKTWLMRGALHLVAAEDLPVFLTGLRSDALQREIRIFRRYGLSEEDYHGITEAVDGALASGPLTRKELADAVVPLLGPKARPWLEHGWGGVLRFACMSGRICFGPNRGRQVTFVRLREWLPRFRSIAEEEAKAALARRYLRAFGPATPQDGAAWSGVSVTETRRVWTALAGEVQEVSLEGRPAFLLAEDLDTLEKGRSRGPVVRLLPHFDGYLLGHKDKGHLVDAAHYKRVYRKAGWISPAVLRDGRVVGVWALKGTGTRLTVKVEPFEPLDGTVRQAVGEEGEALGDFLGGEAEVVFA